MTDYEILQEYKDDAPDIRIKSDNFKVCSNCKFIEQDSEMDSCTIHEDLYHDMDMPESSNFVDKIYCRDFR